MTSDRITIGLSLAGLAGLAGGVPVLLLTAVGPSSTAGRIAAVALLVVQAASLAWMRAHPERSMAVALAAGIGLEALCPQLGVLGLANFSLCVLAALRPPRVSLSALGQSPAEGIWLG